MTISTRFGLVMIMALTACAPIFKDGVVQNRQQAIEAVTKECKLPLFPAYSFHVLLEYDEWIVMHAKDIWIPVDAKTGKIRGCHLES